VGAQLLQQLFAILLLLIERVGTAAPPESYCRKHQQASHHLSRSRRIVHQPEVLAADIERNQPDGHHRRENQDVSNPIDPLLLGSSESQSRE
jgi:hypothetical protein